MCVDFAIRYRIVPKPGKMWGVERYHLGRWDPVPESPGSRSMYDDKRFMNEEQAELWIEGKIREAAAKAADEAHLKTPPREYPVAA